MKITFDTAIGDKVKLYSPSKLGEIIVKEVLYVFNNVLVHPNGITFPCHGMFDSLVKLLSDRTHVRRDDGGSVDAGPSSKIEEEKVLERSTSVSKYLDAFHMPTGVRAASGPSSPSTMGSGVGLGVGLGLGDVTTRQRK